MNIFQLLKAHFDQQQKFKKKTEKIGYGVT